MRIHLVLSSLWLLLLPVPSATAERPLGTVDKALSLAVQVDLVPKDTHQRRPVKPGEVLSAGDRLALRAQVGRDSYVFVLQKGSHGVLEALLPADPKGSGQPVSAGMQTNLPPTGALFELDSAKGMESLYVIASTASLTLQDAKGYIQQPEVLAAEGSVPRVTLRGEPPPPPPPPPPHPVGSTERNPPCDAQVHLIPMRSSEIAKVAVARFCFEHGDVRAPESSKELPQK